MSNSTSNHSPEYWGRQMKFWIGFTAFFILTLWVFSPILLPFVLGIVIAYLLNPIVNKMGQLNISRTISTLIILLGFIVVVGLTFTILIPVASAELLKLIKNLPDYFSQAWAMTESYRQQLEQHLGDEELNQFRNTLENSTGKILELSQGFLDGIVSSGQALISFLSIMIITPLVAFYMMIEWPKITKWIDSHIPQQHGDHVRQILKDIDAKLSGFIRGQMIVAFILGVLYATAMKIAGLNFGLIIGITAGLLSIIPMVGSAVGLLAGITVAWFQSYDIGFVGLIAAIFFAGQILEGYVLTPKLVGDRVGLHPLWILFSLMAGGALFGFVGVLIAVPVAAVISVLVAFALVQYRKSSYYGHRENAEPDEEGGAS